MLYNCYMTLVRIALNVNIKCIEGSGYTMLLNAVHINTSKHTVVYVWPPVTNQ